MSGIPSKGLSGLGFRTSGMGFRTSGLGFSLMWGYTTSLCFLSAECSSRSVTAFGSVKGGSQVLEVHGYCKSRATGT